MTKVSKRIFLAAFLGLSSIAFAGQPSGSAYLDGAASKVGVILCHGQGQHPTWKVVDPLRKGIHEQLGYHTLSLQLPAGKKDWRRYSQDFPRAYQEIEAGIAFLRKEKGVERIYLMGHSMGSRMASGFLADHPDAPMAGFIGVGVRNRGGRPLDSDANLRLVKISVIDVYGSAEEKEGLSDGQARSDMVSERYKQVVIPGASHTFDGHEQEMVKTVVEWLKERNR